MLTVAFESFTLFILLLSVAFLLRQKGSYFKPIQSFLIGAYAFLMFALLSEIANNVIQTPATASWTAIIGMSGILLSALGLSSSAVAISGHHSVFWHYLGLRTEKAVNRPLFLYFVYSIALLVVLWIVQPFELVTIHTLYGSEILIPKFARWYGLAVLIHIIVFMAYPCRLMILQSKKTRSPSASKGFLWMAVSWSVAAALLVGLRVSFRALGIEVGDVVNLLSAGVFSVSAYFFRKTTVLQSFFEETSVTETVQAQHNQVFSRRLGVAGAQVFGRKMLLEIDPAGAYENIVRDFVHESLSRSMVPLVITRVTSPVYKALAEIPKARFLCLSASASYPRQGSSDRMLFLPQDDPSIILGALDGALKTQPNVKLAVVVDNLSDLIILWGTKKSYGFTTYSLVLLTDLNITGLYLLNTSAHDPKTVSMMRALFPVLMAQREGELQLIKS